MTTVISTNKSRLVVYPMKEEWLHLMEDALPFIEESLPQKPPEINDQHRCIEFISNQSKLSPELSSLLDQVNAFFSSSFIGILVIKYVDENDYTERHSEDEKTLDRSVGVVCLSIGEVRTFRVRDKDTGCIVLDVPTRNVIQMVGEFQREFTHEIPVEKKKRGTQYSFTFRSQR